MFGLSFTELLFLGLLALILIGPEELPQVARTLGRLLNEIKRGSDSFKDEFRRSSREFEKDMTIRPDLDKLMAQNEPAPAEKPQAATEDGKPHE